MLDWFIERDDADLCDGKNPAMILLAVEKKDDLALGCDADISGGSEKMPREQ